MDEQEENRRPTESLEEEENELEAFHRLPSSPRRWPRRKKWASIFVLAAMTYVTSLAPSIFAPAIAQTMAEFHTPNARLGSFVVSVYVLGWASGPLVVSPMSELYGRIWVYHVSNALFVAFTVACAASQSLPMLIAFRFFTGSVGSAVLNIGGGTIADLFVQEERGVAMTLWTIGALLGPITGPIMGGFVAQEYGWRWTLWLISIAATVTTALFAAVMRETYAPVLLARQQGRKLRYGDNGPQSSARKAFLLAIQRPLSMLIFSPIILVASLYIALVFGYQYLLITTIPHVFATVYGFSTSALGLVYLGLGIGMLTSAIIFGVCSDPLLKRLARRSGQGMKPEYRLAPLAPGAVLVPAGLFLYGWSAEGHLPWVAPILGTALLGAGLNSILMSLQTYLVDAYTVHAASALAANTVVRSTAGALLPLAGPDMYQSLGLGWGSSVLGFVALLFVPMPFLLMKYGERLRVKSRFHQKAI